MPLYFAYGSNMNRAAMAQRCPASRFVGTAKLMRHRFFISSDGYASVMRDPRHAVWGALWDLALADVPALDRYESLSTGLYTKVAQPVVTPQGPRRALVYIGRSTKPGAPRPSYMEEVFAAASEVGLPADCLQQLRMYLPKERSLGQGAADPEIRQVPKVRPRWSAPSGSSRNPTEIR